MTEYIDRKNLDVFSAEHNHQLDNLNDIQNWLDSIPTADVVPVLRGEWVDGDCSICNYGYLDYTDADAYIRDLTHPKFCGGCGARMEERNDNRRN